jgi:hypothetical protein
MRGRQRNNVKIRVDVRQISSTLAPKLDYTGLSVSCGVLAVGCRVGDWLGRSMAFPLTAFRMVISLHSITAPTAASPITPAVHPSISLHIPASTPASNPTPTTVSVAATTSFIVPAIAAPHHRTHSSALTEKWSDKEANRNQLSSRAEPQQRSAVLTPYYHCLCKARSTPPEIQV